MKRIFLYVGVLLCLTIPAFNLPNVSAQTTRVKIIKQNRQMVVAAPAAPAVTATLNDTFADTDGDGKAKPGEEITYTATIINSGMTNANNVNFTDPLDGNTNLVANSVQTQIDFSQYAVHCTFTTGNGGGGNCTLTSSNYNTTDTNNYTILGGQNSRFTVASSSPVYNAGTQIFQFDATVQNLIAQSLGTIDGATLDAAGIRLFLNNAIVTSGSGAITAANADGTQIFTGTANQPYFQYNQIIAQNAVSTAKTLQFNVPSTVGAFSLDFLISTKAQAKFVINEVLSNPGGTISDANGEWFEVLNTGLFPVNLRNFLINDYNNPSMPPGSCTTFPCERPSHTIASDLIAQPGSFTTFGNTTNTTNNGGVPIDYAYGAALALANSQDGVRIQSPNAVTLDMTIYQSAAISAQNGISRELKDPTLDNSNMDGANWQDATAVYGPGGKGTPKAANTGETGLPSVSRTEEVPSVVNGFPTVSAPIGTLAPGQSATVMFRITVANPLPMGTTQVSSQGTVSGDNFAIVNTDDPATGAGNDATVTPVSVAPTAAEASISGQILTDTGRGLMNARVTLTDGNGQNRTILSNPFGYFAFDRVAAGETLILNVSAKRYVFAPQVISVGGDISGLTFTGQP